MTDSQGETAMEDAAHGGLGDSLAGAHGGGGGGRRGPVPRSGPPVTRLATIGVILAVLILAGIADRSATRQAAVATVTAMPVAAPAAALSSSWFCAGPTSGPSGSPAALAKGRLVIANAASKSVTGTVTLIGSTGPHASRAVSVPANDQLAVPEDNAGPAPYLGAVVTLDGGQAAVQQVVTGSAGTSSTACATSGSAGWYFPVGTTQASSTLSISLLNPYPDDAIADLAFTTEQGQEDPQDFQGIVVPAGGVVGFDIGSHLHGRAAVATTVTVRVGRVVAFETQAVQTQSQAEIATNPPGTVTWPPGVSVTHGAPAPSTSLWWPSGMASDGTTEQYVVYNPGDHEAQVSLQLDLDQGSADPFKVTVDPHGVSVVASNSESRVPKGIGHGAILSSTNGVGVVAARLVQATAPAGITGEAQVLGSVLQVGKWLVPGNGGTDALNDTLVVYNPGAAPVRVSVSALNGVVSGIDGAGDVTVAPHHRYLLKQGMVEPLLVDGNAPVVVENDISPTHAIGNDASIGVPLDQ